MNGYRRDRHWNQVWQQCKEPAALWESFRVTEALQSQTLTNSFGRQF
jgi:hypothetical protein